MKSSHIYLFKFVENTQILLICTLVCMNSLDYLMRMNCINCGLDYFSNALLFDLNMILTKNNIANKINSEKHSNVC